MQIWEIDNIGFFTGKTSIVDDENLTEFDISTPVNTDETNTFYKPKWTGEQWVEGWTQEEIEEYNASLLEIPGEQPTEIDKLRLEQAQANAEIIELMLSMIYGGL